jgi:hypothetical protein
MKIKKMKKNFELKKYLHLYNNSKTKIMKTKFLLPVFTLLSLSFIGCSSDDNSDLKSSEIISTIDENQYNRIYNEISASATNDGTTKDKLVAKLKRGLYKKNSSYSNESIQKTISTRNLTVGYQDRMDITKSVIITVTFFNKNSKVGNAITINSDTFTNVNFDLGKKLTFDKIKLTVKYLE